MNVNGKQVSPCILVTDDDKFTRLLLRQILMKDGYDVVEAKDGTECLVAYEKQQPDMILLDAMMPGMDGFTCCRELQKLPGGDRTPVLMVTGLDDQASVDRAFEAGAIDYITKPIHPPVLRRRLRRILEASWAEQALRESEKKYRSVVNNLKEIIFQINTSGELTFLNPAWTEITGFAVSESLGKNFFDFIHPNDRPLAQQHFHSLLQRQQEDDRYTIRHSTQSGGIAVFEAYSRVMVADHNSLIGISGTLNDITERKRREQHFSVEYKTNRVLATSTTLEKAIPKLLEAVCEELGWARGEYWRIEPEQSAGLRCAKTWHLERRQDEESKIQLADFETVTEELVFTKGMGFPGLVWEQEQPVWMQNILEDERFLRRAIATFVGLHAAFGFPVMAGNELLGVMIFFHHEILPSDNGLLRTMTTVGNQIGQFIKRKQAEGKLHQQNLLLQSELNQAAEYVQSLLPTPFSTDTITIDQQFIPSLALGGDAFDYYWLDEDCLAIYLLDVAGHGVKSALLSISVLNILRSQSLPHTDFKQPNQVLAGLNHVFQMNDYGEDYFTIWYGVYNTFTRQLIYATAGHPPAVLLSKTEGTQEAKISELGQSNLPIGMFPGIDYDQDSCVIHPQSTLFVFSDGVYEINLGNGKIWGMEAFVDVLVDYKKQDTTNLNSVLKKIQKANQYKSFEDDFSLLQVNLI